MNAAVDLKVQWLQAHSYVYHRKGLFFFFLIYFLLCWVFVERDFLFFFFFFLRELFSSYRGRRLPSSQ